MEAKSMNADKIIQYLDTQKQAILAVTDQLDEVQVVFNAQFDEFKAQHDATLDRLAQQVTGRMADISPDLRTAIQEQQIKERGRIDERRQKIREEYLPQRRDAADDLLKRAQAELAELRALNPQLDQKEETLKGLKARLEAELDALNKEIRHKSRGLRLVRHFLAITRADWERHRILGRLETISESLRDVRHEWKEAQKRVQTHQAAFQETWQPESIAIARLQSELDQLDDGIRREDLALRRAIRYVLDALKEPPSSSSPELDAGLQQMIELNIRTDAYHEGLASVGGVIGLLRGLHSGMEAIGSSIAGLIAEQEMHKAYLKPLDFHLPPSVEAFHEQWATLAPQFADEKTIGAHPIDFSAAVQPLLDGPLSQARIEAMFGELGAMIEQATAAW
jgi:hypothetical protein